MMNLRLALLNRFPSFYVNESTLTPSGFYGDYFKAWGIQLFKGFNVSWSPTSVSNDLECINGTCRGMSLFIQSNYADLEQIPCQFNNYDGIYPNLTFSPILEEKQCVLLTYHKHPFSEYSADCLTNLINGINLNLIVSFIILVIFIVLILMVIISIDNPKLTKPESFQLSLNYLTKFLSLKSQESQNQSKCSVGMVGVSISFILLSFQLYYSASFQTELTVTQTAPPVGSLQDLIKKDLVAGTIQISSCYRGIKNSALLLNPTLDKHLIVYYSTMNFTSALINTPDIFVFLGTSWEINSIKFRMEEITSKKGEHYLGKFFERACSSGNYLSSKIINSQSPVMPRIKERIYSHFETYVYKEFHRRFMKLPSWSYQYKTSLEIREAIFFHQLNIENYHFYFILYSLSMIVPCSLSLFLETFISNYFPP